MLDGGEVATGERLIGDRNERDVLKHIHYKNDGERNKDLCIM